MSKNLSTLAEFCRDHSVGKTYAYEEIGAGRLQASKAGRKTVITAEAAEAWRASLPKINARKAAAQSSSNAKASAKSEHTT